MSRWHQPPDSRPQRKQARRAESTLAGGVSHRSGVSHRRVQNEPAPEGRWNARASVSPPLNPMPKPPATTAIHTNATARSLHTRRIPRLGKSRGHADSTSMSHLPTRKAMNIKDGIHQMPMPFSKQPGPTSSACCRPSALTPFILIGIGKRNS